MPLGTKVNNSLENQLEAKLNAGLSNVSTQLSDFTNGPLFSEGA